MNIELTGEEVAHAIDEAASHVLAAAVATAKH
jgi:hypothetical protein